MTGVQTCALPISRTVQLDTFTIKAQIWDTADEPTGSWLPLDAKLPFVHTAGCLAWPSVVAGVLGAV